MRFSLFRFPDLQSIIFVESVSIFVATFKVGISVIIKGPDDQDLVELLKVPKMLKTTYCNPSANLN